MLFVKGEAFIDQEVNLNVKNANVKGVNQGCMFIHFVMITYSSAGCTDIRLTTIKNIDIIVTH